MAQAEEASTTTRRKLLGALAASPLLVAPALAEAAMAPSSFAAAMAVIHPNGRQVADDALAAGMKPEQLCHVIVRSAAHEETEHWPVLLFALPDGEIRTFQPNGVD